MQTTDAHLTWPIYEPQHSKYRALAVDEALGRRRRESANPKDLTFSPRYCKMQKSGASRMYIAVLTAPNSKDRRDAVRQSWMKTATRVKVEFIQT